MPWDATGQHIFSRQPTAPNREKIFKNCFAAIGEAIFRKNTDHCPFKVVKTLDYSHGLDGLPPSDVLKFILENGSVVIRPSGTEPKLKAYISVTAENKDNALEVEKMLCNNLGGMLK